MYMKASRPLPSPSTPRVARAARRGEGASCGVPGRRASKERWLFIYLSGPARSEVWRDERVGAEESGPRCLRGRGAKARESKNDGPVRRSLAVRWLSGRSICVSWLGRGSACDGLLPPCLAAADTLRPSGRKLRALGAAAAANRPCWRRGAVSGESAAKRAAVCRLLLARDCAAM